MSPYESIAAYQRRETGMRLYANQFHTADLPETARAVIDLDDEMFDLWRKMIPSQPDSFATDRPDKYVARSYSDYVKQRDKAAEALRAACTVSK